MFSFFRNRTDQKQRIDKLVGMVDRRNATITALSQRLKEEMEWGNKLKNRVHELRSLDADCRTVIVDYLKLHDRISEMIEDGRLEKQDIPKDYEWIVCKLSELANKGGSHEEK